VRNHFDQAYLGQNPPTAISSVLAEYGQLRLVTVTGKQPDSLGFVVSVRGAQHFHFTLGVDARGLIASLSA